MWGGERKQSRKKKKGQQKQRLEQQHKIHRKKNKKHLYTLFQKAKQLTVQNFPQSSLNLLCGTRVYTKDAVPNLDMVHKSGDALKRILKITPN